MLCINTWDIATLRADSSCADLPTAAFWLEMEG